MRPIRVLSLFDGMSCGQIALRELGIPVAAYYASEVDKFAIAQTQLNFPETIQLGDVRNIDVDRLCDEAGEFDLLLAGFPCTDLSLAGKRRGMSTTTKEKVTSLSQYIDLKDAGFEFAGQSYLFWEFVRIFQRLRERNPKLFFLLENVEVGKEWEAVISNTLGLKGVHINAALVSAQNRRRIYWTNIRVREEGMFGWRYTDIPQPEDRHIFLKDILESEVDEKYYLKDNVLLELSHNRHLQKNLTDVNEKAQTFLATSGKGAWANGMTLVEAGYRIRRITPTEAARLQTIPECYHWTCSETQQYKLLGNGWCVEVIKHILSFMNIE